jgi:hypothetical protein
MVLCASCSLTADRFFVINSMETLQVQSWFSGIIAACHAVDPGSIPGDCKKLFYFICAHESESGNENDIGNEEENEIWDVEENGIENVLESETGNGNVFFGFQVHGDRHFYCYRTDGYAHF